MRDFITKVSSAIAYESKIANAEQTTIAANTVFFNGDKTCIGGSPFITNKQE